CLGLQRLLWGYFKKMIVADRILTGVSTMIGAPDTYQGAWSVVLMLFYTIELFADFTGGIDITIGIAQVMGIKVQENFDRPYFSCSLKEYWRRWHISMCSWFREYVFYPVSVCAPMQKLSKFTRKHLGNELGKRIPVHLSSFAGWFATGIWHGASWNFVVWGLANWLILMVSEELEPVYARFHGRFHVDGKRLYKLFCIARTFVLVYILNLFDCFESVKTTFFMFGSVFTARNWQVLWDGSLLEIGLSAVDYAVLAAAAGVMLCVSLCQRNGSVRAMVARKAYPVRFLVWFGLFLAVLLAGAYGIGYDASQFIYNRF
ncbi:MAG: MBOAT family protein, partial [Clostridiales bacterium]|nr:MBOAT family protein [Clostridiales bacterium]